MNILGLNYCFHDSSACLVEDGILTIALEEERFSRKKHTNSFPSLAADKCLESRSLNYSDIDYIAISYVPTLNWPAKALHLAKRPTKFKSFLRHELLSAYFKERDFKKWFNSKWSKNSKKPAIHYIPHHMSHVAGSFYVSPYQEAALLGIDGAGEWATSLLGVGKGTEIECFNHSYYPQSLGAFYEAATEFCGFKPNYDEGKTMGLAPLGDASVFYDQASKLVSITKDGRIKLDQSYFNFQYWEYRRCSDKFYKVFGNPRTTKEFEDHHLHVAAAFQKVLEERVLEMCEILHNKTQMDYLVISGGVSLNSVMNGRIVRESKFKDLYVMPAAGDNGTSIGAAYYLYNNILKQPREFVHNNPYIGNSYTNDEYLAIIKESKLKHEFHEDITGVTAKILNEGNIICWHQGGMEIGPRALGNRSILANPVLPDMKDKINAEVKHREAYRPFAPSCTVEARQEFFDIEVEAPFMLKVCDVLEDKKSVLPAITHVDGSARLQTVRKETNPRYHELLTKFGELSGAPVLLNTSFNIMGEPIVESPYDAIRCFFSTGLDVLVLGNYVIRK